MPRFHGRRTVHSREDDEDYVAGHDDAHSRKCGVAVGFGDKKLEVEAQEGKFREGGRGEVDVAFNHGILEPPVDLGFICGHDVVTSVTVFDEDCRRW